MMPYFTELYVKKTLAGYKMASLRLLCGLIVALASWSLSVCQQKHRTEKPNIIIILADDLGYGSVEVLNRDSKIPTPNLNRLASEGLIFTDAHSASAVCTPTRYGLLTGRYSWRTRLKAGVLSDYAGTLIEPGRLTIGEMLKQNGYHTGMVGKWHLGLDWKLKDETAKDSMATDPRYSDFDNIDFSSPVTKGINDYGFDYSFAIAGSAEMNPSTFIKNGRVTVVPTLSSEEARETQGEWYGRDNNNIAEGFFLEDLVPTFSEKACEFIEEASQTQPDKPFFLYYPLTSPHNPIIPNKEFLGKSGAGAYGDFIVELDHHIGKLLDKLVELGIDNNTMIIFTSDNGAIDITKNGERWIRGDRNIYGHMSNAPFSGWKTQRLEGGHHVPFFVRWPEKIKPGDKVSTTICINDIFPTLAEMLEIGLDSNTAEDGRSFFKTFAGTERPVSFHEAIVHHGIDGQFAIRKENYKLMVEGPNTPQQVLDNGTPLSFFLYDVANDIKETTDIAATHPEKVGELHALLKTIIMNDESH